MNILFLPVSIIENFRNIEELSKQNEILYGLMARGATEALFKVLNIIKLQLRTKLNK